MKHAKTHTFADEIEKLSGAKVDHCYQCGKCTAGCPMAQFMDLKTNQIMHLAHLGDEESIERLLRSGAIWMCVSCETCSTRCPKEVDPAEAIEALRHLSFERDMVSDEVSEVMDFHRAFLDAVRFGGRLNEFFLVADYKMRSWDFLQDVLMAPIMLLKGKLHFFPHKIKGADEVKRIFDKCMKSEEGLK